MHGPRRSNVLVPDDVERLPGRCASCLRWERYADVGALARAESTESDVGSSGRGRSRGEVAARVKRRWWVEGLSTGTVGGLVVRAQTANGVPDTGDDGGDGAGMDGAGMDGAARVAAYVTYALPVRAGDDALTVLALHVAEERRGSGLGRALVHQVAREALRRPRVRAVEALAQRSPGVACLVPLDFWLACGFTIVREHPLTPRVRLDARVLATLRVEVGEAVELAWDRLRGAVRPEPAPRPALRTPRRGDSPVR